MKNLKKILKIFIKFKRFFILAVIIIALFSTVFVYLKKEGRVKTDNAQILASVIDISPQISGVLNEVDVLENQSIQKGDLLAIVGTQALRAPNDGIIINTSRQIGEIMTPASRVIEMINPADFRVVGTVDENKGLKDIKVGQVASFTVDAFGGKTFWGYVDLVSPTAKQTQLAFSISNERPTQQFNVYVRFDENKYPELKNGMSAKLTIYTKTN